jgi:hypothetical protein
MSDPQSVLAALKDKRQSVTEHYDKLASERAAISYAALGEGDAAAQRRLEQINVDTSKIDTELSSIDSAIKTAQERVRD